MLQYKIYALGDSALTIQLGTVIEEAVNENVIALANHLRQQSIIGVQDIIPAYTTVTVVYDLFEISKLHKPVYPFVKNKVEAAIATLQPAIATQQRCIEIPVCYDIDAGIDLIEMSITKNISVEEIIELHCGQTYRVYMLGFLPGFAYMGKVNAKIATQRKQQPRVNINAGSVGIAGEQTGIYPFNSPGGWNIIGSTPLKMFDAKREQPSLLQPGDCVTFKSISKTEYGEILGF